MAAAPKKDTALANRIRLFAAENSSETMSFKHRKRAKASSAEEHSPHGELDAQEEEQGVKATFPPIDLNRGIQASGDLAGIVHPNEFNSSNGVLN